MSVQAALNPSEISELIRKKKFNIPKVDSGRKLVLNNLRHPLIETQDNITYVENDMILDDSVQGIFHVISCFRV